MAGFRPSEAQPLVSVVVPVFNGAVTLAETLRSVAAQTYMRLEIIIVDDGSTDPSARIAADFCAHEPRARLVRKDNGGVASARNRGIAEAGGDWIAPIDADDLWHPTKIEKQVDAAIRAPAPPGLVYCWFHYVDAKGRVVGSGARYLAAGRAFLQMAHYNFVGNGSAPLLNRAAVVAAGGYDESLRARHGQGCEDLALQLRIARDWPVAAVPEHLVGYRVQPGTMSRNCAQMARSWSLVHEQLKREGPAAARILRRSLGMRWLELAEASALAGDWLGFGRFLAKALASDPLRCGATLAYRVVRASAHRVRGRRPRTAYRHFGETGATDFVQIDRDEIRPLALLLAMIDERRLKRLAAIDAAQSDQSRPISR